jgi:hypothetical protein
MSFGGHNEKYIMSFSPMLLVVIAQRVPTQPEAIDSSASILWLELALEEVLVVMGPFVCLVIA